MTNHYDGSNKEDAIEDYIKYSREYEEIKKTLYGEEGWHNKPRSPERTAVIQKAKELKKLLKMVNYIRNG